MSRRKPKDTVQDAPTEQMNKGAVATTQRTTNNMSEGNSILDFSEDLSNAEAPVPLPKGDYAAEIRAAERKTSATTGNDYVSVTFYIAPEQYPADYTDGDPDGTTLTFNRVSMKDSVAGRYRLRKFIEAIGGKLGKQVDLNDWIGLTAVVTVDHREWEGAQQAEIKTVVAA